MPASPASYISPFAPPPPQRGFSRRGGWLAWACVAAGALLWLGLIIGAPLAAASGRGATAFLLYQGLKAACHQMPERAFWLAGHPLAVCARCFGIYAGFAIAALLCPLATRGLRHTATAAVMAAGSPRRVWLILALLPTVIDFTLGITGLWTNTHTSRLLTGAWLGGWVAFYVVPGVLEIVRERRGRRSAEQQQQQWPLNKSEIAT